MKRDVYIVLGNRCGKSHIQMLIDELTAGGVPELLEIIYEQTIFPWQRVALEALANGDRVTVY